MHIATFLKQSFIDWSPRLCAVIFTAGCNFRCGYCHNPELVLPELVKTQPKINADEILIYLEKGKEWLDGAVISGGEPTIHSDLPELLKAIKNIHYNVKLDTNGSNPEMLRYIIENNLVNCIAMDIKTLLQAEYYRDITGVDQDDLIEKIKNSVEILKSSKISYNFRTTLIPGKHTRESAEILQKEFRGHSYVFQKFREGNNLSLKM